MYHARRVACESRTKVPKRRREKIKEKKKGRIGRTELRIELGQHPGTRSRKHDNHAKVSTQSFGLTDAAKREQIETNWVSNDTR